MKQTQRQLRQAFIRQYRAETGESAVDMHDVARHAQAQGWELPKPLDPIDLLAAQFSDAAREEVREDSVTHRPYRANHAFPVKQGPSGQLTWLWVDIDDAPRGPMLKSLVNRREQIVGDVVQLTFDAEHWNRINPDEEAITMPADFTDDVEWRRNEPHDKTA